MISAGVLLLALSLTQCNKFLDVNPDLRAELNGVSDIKALLITAYPSGSYANMTETASDNVTDKGPGAQGTITRVENESVYRFEDNNGVEQDYVNNYWNSAYEAIAAANTALEYIENVAEADRTPYLPYRGEALLCRAYAHFMLVSLFAKTYNPLTAANDPGIPYVTVPEKNVQPAYSRGTVASVYDQIARDIDEGMLLINDDAFPEAPKFHFNRAAAHGFASRFYLFKREYQRVVAHANQVYTDGFASNLRPWRTFYNTLSFEQQLLRYTSTSENANLLLLDNTSWYGRNHAIYRFGVTFNIASRVYGSNVTGGSLSLPWYYTAGNTDNVRTVKFTENFVYTSISDGIGVGHVMWPALTAEEVLFNRAEAYIQQGNYNAALTDLNVFASRRVNGYNPQNHNITLAKVASYYQTDDVRRGLLSALLDLKRYEFIQEGMRWFDILRHDIPVVHEILGGPENEVIETIRIGPNDPRRVFQLPEEATLAGIELNPR